MPDSSFYVHKVGPIHASTYISTDQILLGSGAGPSKTGQRNKLATYSISQSLASSINAAERSGVCTAEALFADDEDAPSSFAIHKDLIFAGVNESAAARKVTGDNHHLRQFRLKKQVTEKSEEMTIKVLTQHQIYEDLSVELDDYQKITKCSEDGKYIALISSEGHPAIVQTALMTRMPIEALDSDPKRKILDLELSDGKLWILEAKTITTISLPQVDDPVVVLSIADSFIPKNFSFFQIRVLESDTILLGLNDVKMNYAFVATYKFRKGRLVQDKIAHISAKIRGLYISTKEPTPTNPRLIALTTNTPGQLILYDNELNQVKTWHKLHQFPISTVAFRGDEKQLITCSIDEKVNVLDIVNIQSEVSLTAQLFMFILAVLLAYLMYLYLSRS